MKPSQLWRFHSSSEKYSCSNPLINVCLADVSMETVFTAPQCSKNGSKVIRAPGEGKWHRYDGQQRRLTGVGSCMFNPARMLSVPTLSLTFSHPCVHLKLQEWGDSGITLLLVCLRVFISAPFQAKSSRSRNRNISICLKGQLGNPDSSCVAGVVSPHSNPPTHYTPLHFELKDATEKKITHSLPQSSVFHCTFLAATLRQHII